METFNLFKRKNAATKDLGKGVPFVISMDGDIYSDPTGQATDFALSGGAVEVLAAGRWVVRQGRALVVSNESPTYKTSFAQMRNGIAHFAASGMNLEGDGNGVLIFIYSALDEAGNGIGSEVRYRVSRSPAGIDLIPET